MGILSGSSDFADQVTLYTIFSNYTSFKKSLPFSIIKVINKVISFVSELKKSCTLNQMH